LALRKIIKVPVYLSNQLDKEQFKNFQYKLLNYFLLSSLNRLPSETLWKKPISTAFYGWSLNGSLNWDELGQSVPAALEGKLKCAHVAQHTDTDTDTGSLRCFVIPKDYHE